MNKTAIKNFAVWARNKLIADITYKAGLIGVSDKASLSHSRSPQKTCNSLTLVQRTMHRLQEKKLIREKLW